MTWSLLCLDTLSSRLPREAAWPGNTVSKSCKYAPDPFCQYATCFNKLALLFSLWGNATLCPEFLKLVKPRCIYCILKIHHIIISNKAGKVTYAADMWDAPYRGLVEKSFNFSPLFQEHIKSPAIPCSAPPWCWVGFALCNNRVIGFTGNGSSCVKYHKLCLQFPQYTNSLQTSVRRYRLCAWWEHESNQSAETNKTILSVWQRIQSHS